jgi:hypothetical protein
LGKFEVFAEFAVLADFGNVQRKDNEKRLTEVWNQASSPCA